MSMTMAAETNSHAVSPESICIAADHAATHVSDR